MPLTRAHGGALVAALLVGSVVPAWSQATEPSARATRTDRSPIIDGRLDDAAWGEADAISEFRQRDPDEGLAGTEQTIVRIVYDRTALYIGAILLDSDPGGIVARALRRDSEFDGDDRFSVILDTFHDHRNGFLFAVNPNGAMLDGVVRNEAEPDTDWDEQWYAATTIGADGWTVEMQIPFRILRFPTAGTLRWGVDFERIVRRKNEEVYWSNWSRDFDFEQVSQAGVLTGLVDIEQSQRIRLRPYVSAGMESVGTGASAPDRVTRAIGIDDLRVAVTSTLAANATVNPDFAQTEADARRVNLTRFNLFFPEKRRFFVEGSASLRMGLPDSFGDESLQLFHSRTVGLSPRGEPIPLAGGTKLTGKIAGTDIGVLAARSVATQVVGAESFGVFRFQREVAGRSYFGAIGTARDGTRGLQSTVGADAQIVLKRYLRVSSLVAATHDPGGSWRWSRFGGLTWSSDRFDASAAHVDVEAGFNPALGFVRRHDRRLQLDASYKPRPASGRVRQFALSPSLVSHYDPQGALLTREVEFEVETEFQSGDEIEVSLVQATERLPEPFEISDGVVLPGRRFDWRTAAMDVRTFEGRPVSGSLSVETGGFYSGSRSTVEMSATVRAGRHVAAAPTYAFNEVALHEGRFRTHLLGLRFDGSFSRNLLASAFVQYDSEGRLASVQVRLNWILRNIDNFYVVFNQTTLSGRSLARRTDRSLVAKVTYSVYR